MGGPTGFTFHKNVGTNLVEHAGHSVPTLVHVLVVILVPKKAAVAMYYSEGSMKPKNAPAVSHYLTRVTQVYVKEGGTWKIRASHWSPVSGGSGTSQTALN